MKERHSNTLFVVPFMLMFVSMLVIPLFWGMWLSLLKVDLFAPGQFVGFRNYERLFNDRVFLQALRNTVVFVVFSVPTLVVIGLGLRWHSTGRVVYRQY